MLKSTRSATPGSVPQFERVLFGGTFGLFFLVLLLGGGGAPAPLMQAFLEILGLFWLLFLFWAHLFVRPISNDARLPGILLLCALLVPAIQLIPLPFNLWSTLPGREIAAEAGRLAGAGEPWAPLSLMPEGTRVSGLQLIPTAAILFGTYMLEPEERLALARIPIIVAIISALVASVQVAMPGTSELYLFQRSNFTSASGLFANRNFQASMMLLGILLCAFQIRLARMERPHRPGPNAVTPGMIYLLVIPLLAIMALATLSRTGAVLLGPVLIAAAVIASTSKVSKAVALGAGGAALAAGALFLAAPGFVQPIMERLQEGGTRADTWGELRHVVGIYFPVGSGLGTFDPVFRASESLDFLQPAYFNHAHNDYVEILIEAGVLGAGLVVVVLLLLAWRSISVWRGKASTPYMWLQRTATIGIGLLLLHSTSDYPLRTMALQALFAFFCALLFSRAPVAKMRRERAA